MQNHENSPVRVAVARLLGQVARQWRKAVDARLRPFGLTEATWLPLLYLANAETPMRQKDLASILSLDNSSVVRLIDALEAAGLAERRDEPTDRRVKTIHPLPAAHTVIEQVEDATNSVRTELLDGLSEDDIAVTHKVLLHIKARLKTLGSEDDDD